MKTLKATIIIFAFILTPLLAVTPETLQERLVRVELEYADAMGMGYTIEHPKVKGLQAELEVLNKTSGIRNEKYWELLKEKKNMLEVDLAKLAAEGFAAEHPKVQSVKKQMAVIENTEKKKS